MKKRLLASLTALCLTLSAVTVLQTAGLFVPEEEGRYSGFMVETDGTEITQEMISAFDGCLRVQTWEDFTEQHYRWTYTTTSVIPDGPAYIISTEEMDEDTLISLTRSMMLDYDFIESAYFFDYVTYDEKMLMWEVGGVFLITPTDLSDPSGMMSIPELSECHFVGVDENEEGIPTAYIVGIPLEVDYESTELYRMVSEAVGEREDYQYAYLCEYAEILKEKYSNWIASCEVTLGDLESAEKTEAATTPIWQTAGDHNADGETNANDAAELLMQAAQEGVAEASETTVSPDSDVNLDGVADATDAAYILQYSALKGSGAEADWVEILK